MADLVVPNLRYDKQLTEQQNTNAAESVSPTSGYVSAGQYIVKQDEIVTAEIDQIMASFSTTASHPVVPEPQSDAAADVSQVE